jgi:hypothetical protein
MAVLAPFVPLITAVSAAASAGAGIAAAVNKPETPKGPPVVPNREALMAERARAVGAQGRQQTQVAGGTKLGNVGG